MAGLFAVGLLIVPFAGKVEQLRDAEPRRSRCIDALIYKRLSSR